MTQSIAPEPGRIAVIGGTGPEGWGLAARWAKAGLDVVIGSRELARAEGAAERVRERVGAPARARGMENAAAAAISDTVVLCVPFSAQLPTLKGLEAALRPGQVLVDCTVPLSTAVGGRPTTLLGVWQGSAAQQTAAAVPRGLPVVGAFHNVSAPHLEDLDHPIECDVLVCGDSREAKQRVSQLVAAIDGCRYVDAGPLANARIVESLTALIVGINIRYKVRGAGVRLTGVFDSEHGHRSDTDAGASGESSHGSA